MINLKIIKNNKIVYDRDVLKVSVNAENLGIVEFQQGCANAVYKIHGDVKYVLEQKKAEEINITDGIINVSPESIEIVE